MNACRSESCTHGRKSCPCPSACQWPAEDDQPERDYATAIVTVAVICCIALSLAAVLFKH